jgi:translocation and assembly module TamB
MRAARRLSRWLGIALAAVIFMLLAGFGLLQTGPGQYWLARAIAQMASTPSSAVSIHGLHGFLPFRVAMDRITLADAKGSYLTLDHTAFAIAPSELLAGRLHVTFLRIAAIDMTRSSTGSSRPLTDYLQVPHLPLSVVLDRLTIARLALAPAVLGESVVATIAGNGAVANGSAHAALDLHRIDGRAGTIAMRMALSGTEPALSLRLRASEPTGLLLDDLLRRTDRLPLAVSLDGAGPIADWHGRLIATAGKLANFDAELALAVGPRTVVGLAGTAAVAALLPPDLAPVVGDKATVALHAEFAKRYLVDRLALGLAAGKVAGDSSFDRTDGTIAAHLRASAPDLARLSRLLGSPLQGAADLNIAVSGTQARPVVKAGLTGTGIRASGSGAEHVAAEVSAAPSGPLDNPQSRIAVTGHGRIDRLIIPAAGALARRLGADIEWSFAGAADPDTKSIDVTRFAARSGGLDLTGSGKFSDSAHGVTGAATLAGSAIGLRTGIAALDALLGGKASLAAVIRRDQAGGVALDKLTLDSAVAELSGKARFDPAAHQLAAEASLDVPQLQPLGPPLGAKIAGSATAELKAEGALDHLRLGAAIDGRGITVSGRTIERLQLSGAVADLAQRQAVIDGAFRASGLDGSLSLVAALSEPSELVIPRLRLTAANTAIDGNLRIALGTGLVQGSLAGRIPDLGRWSRLAGTPLGGSLDLSAKLAAASGGQGLDLSANATRLSAGSGGSRVAVGHLAMAARFADLRRRPVGTGRLSLQAARLGAADFTSASASVSIPQPGRIAFAAAADGHPLSLALAGEGAIALGGAELRLSRLTGMLGRDRFALAQPLDLSRRGDDISLRGLDLRLGRGRISGGAAVNGQRIAAVLNAADLPIAAGARLIGRPQIAGSLSLDARLDGSFTAPHGRVVLNADDLSLSAVPHAAAPKLGLTVAADWNGRMLGVQGQVTGLVGDRLAFTGSAPLVLRRAPLAISLPRQGPLALRLQGGGDLSHLAELLPLGEDRMSGRFAADVMVGGTVGSPIASGRLTLNGGRYENFASGAVLTDLDAEIVGDRGDFRLASLSAGDGAGGKLTAQGSVVLSGASGPSTALTARFANFRLAARDEVQASASGTVSVAGSLSAPKVAAALTVDRANVTLPNSLPPSVVVLNVTEINGKSGGSSSVPPPANAAATLPMALQISLLMPGQVLVSGHGLTSDWHGRLDVTGTTAEPRIAGVLIASRGSINLLGKSFLLTRGRITFDGGAKLDPSLDIVAEASASDITAQVIISGYASAPKITLTSSPPVPQDEILSRLLFNQGVGQITPSQGAELAQAAATLAGGGPNVLGQLQSKLGLDWFGFGQGPAAAANPILNPSVVSPTTSSAAALSAGKYLAHGVSIGVTQGISPPTSKVTVQVDIGHHLTVDTEAGQNGGTGIGLDYKYDY